MVESLKKLNPICQKPHYKKVGNWMVRNITRDMALPLTWLLLHTPISANGVTLAGMILVLGAGACLASTSPSIFLIGALLFQFWYLLDHVDGQIARYRKQSSLTGLYFDFLSHYVTNSVIFFGFGLHVYFATDRFETILLSFLGSLSYALLQSFFDCKYRAYYAALCALEGREVRVLGGASDAKGEKTLPGLRKVFSLLYKLCEIHVFMNLLTLVAVFNFWNREIHFFGVRTSFPIVMFGFYSVLLPLIVSVRIGYAVARRSIDRDFEKEFVQVR
jgi:phosphatidylglycerophosphate synthase